MPGGTAANDDDVGFHLRAVDAFEGFAESSSSISTRVRIQPPSTA